MKHVVVGVDGSSVASDALMWAADVATKLDAEVVAAHCFRHPYAEVNPEDHERLLAERQHTLSKDWTAAASHLGAKVRAVVTEGDPRNALLSMAEVGVALKVLHHASVPLVLVPGG
jgi:nucleotide-binding universal stress UspA family protein